MDVHCPRCFERERLTGTRDEDGIGLVCGVCGERWERQLDPTCSECDGRDLEEVPLAIVEKSRGTQLSVVGTRQITLCYACDAETLARWHKNRPNPLMPDELPTVGKIER